MNFECSYKKIVDFIADQDNISIPEIINFINL